MKADTPGFHLWVPTSSVFGRTSLSPHCRRMGDARRRGRKYKPLMINGRGRTKAARTSAPFGKLGGRDPTGAYRRRVQKDIDDGPCLGTAPLSHEPMYEVIEILSDEDSDDDSVEDCVIVQDSADAEGEVHRGGTVVVAVGRRVKAEVKEDEGDGLVTGDERRVRTVPGQNVSRKERAYARFSQVELSKIGAENPGLSPGEVAERLHAKWTALQNSDRGSGSAPTSRGTDSSSPSRKRPASGLGSRGGRGSRCLRELETTLKWNVKAEPDDPQEEEEAEEEGEEIADKGRHGLVNRRIRKWFPEVNADFEGTISRVDVFEGECYYFVKYDDGDAEHISKQEIKKYLLGNKNAPVQKRHKADEKMKEKTKGRVANGEKDKGKQHRAWKVTKPDKPAGTQGVPQEAVPRGSDHDKAALIKAVVAAMKNAKRAKSVNSSVAPTLSALPNPRRGVVIGRPQPAPVHDELVVLSHVLSPKVAKQWKIFDQKWKRQFNLLNSNVVDKHTLCSAVAATVAEARVVGSAHSAAVGEAASDAVHPIVNELDVPTALAELIVAHLVSRLDSRSHSDAGSGGKAGRLGDSRAVTSALDLPAQLPYTDAVEPFEVPPDDPRVGLAGELGVRAVRHIPKGTLLGPYATYVCTRSEYKSRRFQQTPGATHEVPVGMGSLYAELDHNAFAADFVSVDKHTDLHKELGEGMVADAYGYGNLALAVNDPSPNPFGDQAESVYEETKAADAKVNVHLIEVSIHNFPFMFHITVRDVEPGEELLMAYGQLYWEHVRECRKRIRSLIPGHDSPLPSN